ncbi:hypothetical protein AAEX28_06565 [Lentisphaerota bacterium WC36G]|nr:hypothetical protein LJT99_09430 [Lentisphaerae bacterium WC36]
MQQILQMIEKDPTVKVALMRFQKIKTHVNYFLSNGHEKLATGRNTSNCVYALAQYLLPALMTYQNIRLNTKALFGGTSSKARMVFGKKRDLTKNIAANFMILCREIEVHIPALEFGVNTSALSLTDQVNSKRLSAFVLEKANNAVKRKSSSGCSFWVIAALYYKETPNNQALIPDSTNLMQVVPYTQQRFFELEDLIKDTLNDFCVRNKNINSVKQTSEAKPGLATTEHPLESTIYYTQESPSYTCIDFAVKAQFQREALDEMAQDLFAYSMQIESWESLLYISPETRCLEYLPQNIACCYLLVATYGNVFNFVRSGEFDDAFIGENLALNFKLYISSLHLFMRSIYDLSGQVTETAEYILSGFRSFKRNSVSRLVTARGVNIWQPGAIGNNCREGKQFY